MWLFKKKSCNVDESGNFQKPLKMTSLKQIYLQIEKKYIQDHNHSQTLSHITLRRTNYWINLPHYNFNPKWQTDKLRYYWFCNQEAIITYMHPSAMLIWSAGGWPLVLLIRTAEWDAVHNGLNQCMYGQINGSHSVPYHWRRDQGIFRSDNCHRYFTSTCPKHVLVETEIISPILHWTKI